MESMLRGQAEALCHVEIIGPRGITQQQGVVKRVLNGIQQGW
jgi:hypothetical protein